MEKALTELRFNIVNFDKFYVNYLTRQNEFLDLYFKRIKSGALDEITYQEVIIDEMFCIKIIKKISNNSSGGVDYSDFKIVFKYEFGTTEESALEDLYAFISLLSVFGGVIFKPTEVTAIVNNKQVELTNVPFRQVSAPKIPRLVLNNNNVDVRYVLKNWYRNYRNRAFCNIVYTYMTALARSGNIRRDIANFLWLVNVLDTVAQDRVLNLKNINKYSEKFAEIITTMPSDSHRRWLQSYADVRQLRLDSRLNLLFETFNNAFEFLNDTSKARLMARVADTHKNYSRLKTVTGTLLEETELPLINAFLSQALRVYILQECATPDPLIKKILTLEPATAKVLQDIYDMQKH